MSNRIKIFLAVLIVLLAAGSRLLAHPWNFTPIAAMSLFAGCYLNKRWAIILPLGAMLIGDYFIGFYGWPVMVSVYGGLILIFFIGRFLARHKNVLAIAGSSLAGSLIFFLITNFSVWAFFSWYPHTFVGLLNCYTLAIPFFKNTLAGDLIYTATLFGVYELAVAVAKNQLIVKEEKIAS